MGCTGAEVWAQRIDVPLLTTYLSPKSCRGLWDLHRLNRDQAIAWFTARREADGIVSSEQKRRPAGGLDEVVGGITNGHPVYHCSLGL
jgi:hypothetical protein